MFVSELDILIRREQYKDLLREAALERLIRIARPRPTDSRGRYQKVLTGLAPK
jgi:hypothetical protein